MKFLKSCLGLVAAAIAVLIVISVVLSFTGKGGDDDKATDSSGGSASSTTASPDSNTKSETKATKPSTKAKPKPKPTPTPTPKPEPAAMQVKAGKMLKEFEDNEAAADAKYDGKNLLVTGVVAKVDTEFLHKDKYVIEVGNGDEYAFTFVNCNDIPASIAAKVKKGSTVKVQGDFDDGGDLGVELADCHLVSQ